MISHNNGNILDAGTTVIVVPVNCIPGVLGAGLARQAARKWPHLAGIHASACRASDRPLRPGGIMTHAEVEAAGDVRIVAMLATKDHWRDGSRIEWIKAGMGALGELVRDLLKDNRRSPVSVAVPPLGAGLGGLSLASVAPVILAVAGALPAAHWHLYGLAVLSSPSPRPTHPSQIIPIDP